MVDADERLKGKTALIVTADHGGRLKTKTHIKADEPLNYTIPFYVWGPGVQAGTDHYAINPDSRTDPGTGRLTTPRRRPSRCATVMPETSR